MLHHHRAYRGRHLVAGTCLGALCALGGCAIENPGDAETLDAGPAGPSSPVTSSTHNWGGVDPNIYRGDYAGRSRAPGHDPNTAVTLVASPDMSTRELEALINDAPPRAQISFTPGRYMLTEQLNIRRGDITLRGSGVDETILDASAGVFADVNAVKIHPAVVERFGSWSITSNETSGRVSVVGTPGPDATRVTLQDASQVSPGDFLFFMIQRTAPNVRRGPDKFYNAMVEVAAVDGDNVTFHHKLGINFNRNTPGVTSATVHLLKQETHMLSNVIFTDLTIDYGEPRNPMDKHRFYNHNGRYIGNELAGDGVRGLVLLNTHECDVERIKIRNAGANGILIANSVEGYVNEFIFDGAQNLGGGGVGYGLEPANSYYGTYENLQTTEAPSRHFVTYNFAATSAFNNVHVLYSTSNIDFHGGPDHRNIYYTERMVLPQKDDYSSPLMDYRDPVNEPENTVVFDFAVAAGDGVIDYTPVRYGPAHAFPGENNGHGYAADGRATPASNTVYASDNGAEITLAGKPDEVYSGAGDDVFILGDGADVAYFPAGAGADIIRDFDPYEDKLAVRAAGLDVEDVLARASEDGGSVRLDLGGGDSITLEGVQLGALSTRNITSF